MTDNSTHLYKMDLQTRKFLFKTQYIVEEFTTIDEEFKQCQQMFVPVSERLLKKHRGEVVGNPSTCPPTSVHACFTDIPQAAQPAQAAPTTSVNDTPMHTGDIPLNPPPPEPVRSAPPPEPESDKFEADDFGDKKKEISDNVNLKQYFKTLYKKLVLLTHPDKCAGIATDLDPNIYIALETDYKHKNYLALLATAFKLKFDYMMPLTLDNMNTIEMNELEVQIRDMETRINDIKKTLIWQYFHTNDVGKQHLENLFLSQL